MCWSMVKCREIICDLDSECRAVKINRSEWTAYQVFSLILQSVKLLYD